jgi:predicted ATPase/class 3 adenylate cyclase
MTGRPSGTVTFLFTDIEGSTRRWEADPDGMRVALAAHDDVVRAAVDANGGWLFKHTGDGVCAAFGSARAAVDAAVDAQRSLELPVRMGVATGEVEQRGEDYFGPALNRAARVMAVGHGGQILVSGVAAGLVTGVDLVNVGEHRLRDLSGVERLFQVRADGLTVEFPPLRTMDAVPGNLPRQSTSFVGRDVEVKELAELVRTHELVTLTGVGGVGKTRLAIQVAAELVPDFAEGVWLVELAPVGDPDAVPDAVATALGITPQPGRSVTASVAETLAGRRLLVVFDNCEHVLEVVADLIEAILGRSSTVAVIATSREGLRVDAEHLWPVPSLDVGGGAGSAAEELFIERARAVVPGFSLDTDVDLEAVTEICRRLDGIALAIELAAARMVSMTPVDVLARLNDRFRLLSGARRGLERHQTLRQAVQWSYDLLTPDEQSVLAACAVFAGGFDITAVTAVRDLCDEYMMLDLLDSLVRKSLVTTSRAGGRARYGLLETIRQFIEDQHATSGGLGELRDRHARHYAEQVIAHWELWDGPGYDMAAGWVDVEFENLRAGFRWAADQADLDSATAIAAHTTIMAFSLQQFEPVGWVEELLPAAAAANLSQLPRLYTAASSCTFIGRAEDGVGYAQAAVALQDDSGYQPFTDGWAASMEGQAHLYAGRVDRYLEICTGLAAQTGVARVLGLCGLTMGLTVLGRSDDAIAIADDTMTAARAHTNPSFIAYAYAGYGRAHSATDPQRALHILREGLAYTRQHPTPFFETFIASEAAGLEAAHGDIDQALDMLAASIHSFHQAGNTANLAGVFPYLTTLFDRAGRPEIAATFYGITTDNPAATLADGFAATVDHLRNTLDADTFDTCARTGATMTVTEAVRYAHHHIDDTLRQRA